MAGLEVLVVILLLALLLGIAASRFGVDSRESFVDPRRPVDRTARL